MRESATDSVILDDVAEESVGPKKVGRPIGSTDNSKLERDVRVRLAMDDMAIEFDCDKREAHKKNKYVSKGLLNTIIKKYKKKYCLDNDVDIKRATIRR